MPVVEPPTIAIPLRVRDKRIAERFEAGMPVKVEGRETVTHDLSTHGLSFESDRPYAPGDRVKVIIDFIMDGHSYPLHCDAIVARCLRHGEGFLVGASLKVPLDDGRET
ncbi:PilZ domain-containing protein [Ramlibacter albus]|uniref:PilZ domain-containing protein n=1 Tax=Ramlibacter albus TaxID=2079448 RepID=A0A923S192_9BURK|nr:PilZ domain-containing protein [Ramlibacter albus]MBC5764179.1 PilZ domain-containing protein [Ramlibacter albus]